MASAAIWLDELGIPPREVCLDWAWQIRTRFADKQHLDEEDAVLNWQRLEVNDAGELVFPSDWQKYSPAERLQELLSWAEGKVLSFNSATLQSDVESELRKLTGRCVGLKEDSIKLQSSSVPEISQVESADATFAPKPIRSQIKTRRSKRSFMDQVVAMIKQHKFVTASIASVVFITGAYFLLSSKKGNAEPSRSVVIATETQELPNGNAKIDDSSELEDEQALATLPVMPQLETIETPTLDLPKIALPNLSSTVISGLKEKDPAGTGPLAPEENSTTSKLPSNETEVARVSSTPTKDASELKDRDVMHELEVLTKSANNEVETDLNVPDSHPQSTVSEPLVLHTSPMVQAHKLAAKIKVRPRQPVWQIILSVDDEFALTPAEPQDISDRQVTTWLISNSDAESPKVHLVIQVQAMPSRQTALRWRIFAGAEDLPDLMLPLDKKVLDPLQDRLQIYSKASQREAERLKLSISTAEREMRTALSKQRVFMESQSKLASRLSTIVAQSQFLDDMLRSQLTMYAKLRDGSGSDAPTVLQFGDPNERQKSDENSKAK